MIQLRDGVRLNSTKLYNPPLPEDYTPRQKLLERLDLISRRPLTLVSAPAGYGKTTALSAWLQKSDIDHAWYSLDEFDNDITLFQTYFLAAIQRELPDFGVELAAIVDRGNSLSARAFVDQFNPALDALERPLVLVLEDFHVIHDADILLLIGELMRHPHPALHLVLLSRHDPPLPLSEWRAHNKSVEIRSADLRFSLEETAALLQAATGRTPDEAIVAALHANTEGWAVGLRLAILSLTYVGEDVSPYFLQLSANNQHVVEFLADHVLAGQTTEQQTFLLQTSILSRLTGELCDAVIAAPNIVPDGQAMLRELTRRNLFITSLDGDRQWFRYHHLLAQFLRSRLLRQYSAEEVARMHLRAGRWFADAGFIEEGIQHMIAAGEVEEAVGLLAAVRYDLLNRERFGRLSSLCNLFPEEAAGISPELLLARAWDAHTMRFDIAELAALTGEIDTLIARLDLAPDRARLLKAENDILKGIALYYDLDPAGSLAHCARGLEDIPRTAYTVRAFAWLYSIGSLHMMGDLSGAYEAINQARHEDLAVPGIRRARNAAAAGFINWMTADLPGLLKTGEYTLQLTGSTDQNITEVWGHYFLASAFYHRNNLTEARRHAERAFAQRRLNRGYFAIYSGFILALVDQVSGNPEQMQETMDQTLAYAIELQSTPLIAAAQAFQVELDIQQGNIQRAVQWAEQALPVIRFAALPLFFAPPLTVPKALLAAGDIANPELLGDYLRRLREHLEAIHNTRFLIETLALEAMFHDSQGNERAAFAALEHSLVLAQPSGFIRLYVDLGAVMKKLLGRLPAKRDLSAYISGINSAFPKTPTASKDGGLVEPLTDREMEVLSLLAGRYSNKEIAAELSISPMTVKRHTINIYQKLYVQGRREAVEAARTYGILE